MKLLGAVFVAILLVAPLPAQYWSVGGFGNVAFPALGHAPAGNPWGNVAFPAVPGGSAALTFGSRPVAGNRYGGLVPGLRPSNSYNGAGRGIHRGRSSGIYAYPVFIGGYGYGYDAPPPDQQTANDNGGNAPATPPVVINQYFNTPPPDQGPAPDTTSSNFHYYQAPANTDTAPSDQSYYLIAFKDHTVYSAVAYYTEGDTLHYFTTGNVHNQVSLSLVDRQLTEQLNRSRNVDVRLPQ
ncbi:MAG TPA: hypothetical protein VMG35_13555 [Bryobacteraceae bacterium]|nr:hypothetical protein [Bryobacteraceae bacterium]